MTWFKKDKKIAWVKGSTQAEKLVKKFFNYSKHNKAKDAAKK